jgi:hypothetical protein
MSNGSRKPNLRSSIYFSETDRYWHGWVTMGFKTTVPQTDGTARAAPKPR